MPNTIAIQASLLPERAAQNEDYNRRRTQVEPCLMVHRYLGW